LKAARQMPHALIPPPQQNGSALTGDDLALSMPQQKPFPVAQHWVQAQPDAQWIGADEYFDELFQPQYLTLILYIT